VLSAFIGKDRDQRLLGSTIALGPHWKELFGDVPKPALGCLEGTCAFHQVVLRGLRGAAAATSPVAAREEEETKKPVQVSQNTVRKPPPPPPPPPRQPVHAKPPPGKRR
jgi:hypothetical protein